MVTRVSDMNVDELKALIQETVSQTLLELLHDPDQGLALRQDFANRLQHSLANVKVGKNTVSAEDVANKLGLSW